MVLSIISVLLTGYLLGSVSASVLISKYCYKKDVREAGSGNAGATNMARTFGIISGLVTLLCDVVKTVLACLFGRMLLGNWGLFFAGVSCMAGHCYPLFFHFKGGKGVSVGTAIAALLGWKVFLFAVIVFFLPATLSKRVSVGSLVTAALLPVWAVVFGCSLPLQLLAAVTAVAVIYRHIPNIKRLLKGEEPQFRAGKQRAKD